MTDSFVFKPLDKTTLHEQVSLFNKVFEKKWSVEEWEYVNYDNPLSKGGNLVGVFDGDRLIGLNAFMAMQFQYKGNIYNALQSCNSAVDPDYQGKGLFKRLMIFAEDYYAKADYDFMMGTPNPNSHPAFKKLGWTDAADLHYLLLQLNSNTIVQRVLKINLPKICNVFSGSLNIKSKLHSHHNSSYTLERNKDLTPENAVYLSSLSNETFTIVNSYDSLKWRLTDTSIVYYTVKDGDKPIAFFIVREHPYIAITGKSADILETCYISDDIKELKTAYGLFITELRKKFDLIWIWKSLNSKKEKSILKSAGYLDFHIRTPYIVKVLNPTDEKNALFLAENIWNPQEIEFDTVVKYVEK